MIQRLFLTFAALAAQTSIAFAEPSDATLAPTTDVAATDTDLADTDLADLAGGQNTSIALTEQDLTAVNSGNQVNADAVTSGAISFSDGALSNFAGIGNFVINTGHNNNLQGSLSVTIVVGQ